MTELLNPSEDRLLLFPIRHLEIFEMAKNMVSMFWTVEELDFSTDASEFLKLDKETQHFIKQILAFFATADGLVTENLIENFCSEVQLAEARYFYAVQAFNEQIHAETYAKLLEVYVGNESDVKELLDEAKANPAVQAKTEFACKHFDISVEEEPDRDRNFAKRLVAFACVEGINFSSSFCGIYWLKERLCGALTLSNQFISRDEGLHRNFAVTLYNKFLHNLSAEEIVAIVDESVKAEEVWVRNSALPEKLVGMNQDLMVQYVKFVADLLLHDLHTAPHYKVSNPFPFMDQISVGSKTNFFEKRVSEYALSGEKEDFNLNEDF